MVVKKGGFTTTSKVGFPDVKKTIPNDTHASFIHDFDSNQFEKKQP